MRTREYQFAFDAKFKGREIVDCEKYGLDKDLYFAELKKLGVIK